MPIIVLQPHIANQIAAGEVVERPASIVKELIENALDAGATRITVEIENGGLDLIRIADNGCGMSFDDAYNAFLRHATSKISTVDDLTHIQTYGFRGEALPSIASVASVEMRTKRAEDESGTVIHIKNGTVLTHTECACAVGTSIEVRELFADVPARLKFLKSPRTEAGYIGDYVSRLIMAAPQISFTYISGGRTVYRSSGDGSLKNAIFAVYGVDIAKHIIPIQFDDGYLSIGGFIGDAEISRPNRTYQSFILNGRYIRSNSLSSALMRAYEAKLMSGKFPFAVLDMHISGYEVDVNVHPAKLEVRFVDEQRVIRSVTAAAHRALLMNDTTVAGATSTDPAALSLSFEDTKPALGIPQQVPLNPVHNPPMNIRSADSYGFRATTTANEHFSMGETAQKPFEITGLSSASKDGFSSDKRLFDELPHATAYTGASDNNDRPLVHQQQSFFDAMPALRAPEEYNTVGCVFDTYWMIESGEDLLFIDQHAAHERLIYEKLVSEDINGHSQPLLIPLEISLTESEKAIAEDNKTTLAQIGAAFSVDEADGKLYLTSMPVLFGRTLDERFFRQAIEICAETGSVSKTELLKSRLCQCACKHAVKAGDKLSEDEINSLLQSYRENGIPMTCPHGRPVMICLKKRELEKLFKRVL